MADKKCYGCKNILQKKDASGGITYGCSKTPGMVIAYDHALFQSQHPCEVEEGCYDPR